MFPSDRSERTRKRSSGALTLHDVARLAGVSPMTVSRALNAPELVSPSVLLKVQQAVRQTGYVRNRMAGGLASSRSGLVAALVPTLGGSVFRATIEFLTSELAAAGYQLLLGQTGYANAREDDFLRAIIGRRPDGIVLTGIERSDAIRLSLGASHIPVVETWDLTADPLDMLVGFSHSAVGAEVATFLQRRAYSRLAVIAGEDERSRRRVASFEATALQLGLPQVRAIMIPSPSTLGDGRRAAAELLTGSDASDAVFCSSDMLALGVMIEAQAQGMRVPDQLAVVGFGDEAMSQELEPALTSVRIDGAGIGRHAARLILSRLAGSGPTERIVDVGFSIRERAST